MKRKRRNYSAEFKARIAMEALQEVKTVAQIAQENQLHPVQITQWKKEARERMHELFQRSNAKSPEKERQEKLQSQLERKVGRLVIEKEFLEKKCVELGIDLNEKP